jgi:hypothetical protein
MGAPSFCADPRFQWGTLDDAPRTAAVAGGCRDGVLRP